MADTTEAEVSQLFREHYPQMVRLATFLTASPALGEELAQEAFVKVWKSWNRIRDRSAAPSYLRKTLVNLSRSLFKRRKLEAARMREIGGLATSPPEMRLEMVDALRGLPMKQRTCVVLRYYEDLSERETAQLMGIAVGTVKSQTHKGLNKLRELIGGEDDD